MRLQVPTIKNILTILRDNLSAQSATNAIKRQT